MPKVRVIFYQEEERNVPVLDWLDRQTEKVKDKVAHRIERLAELGFELHRPEAD
jgi:hypothetical protein